MEHQREVTIYDIANKLKISASTVSRALKDHPAINKKTKKRIFDAAAHMGYRSNLFARNLREQKTMTIGLMVYDLKSAFITSLVAGIEKIANEAGYGIIIADSGEDEKKEAANAGNLFNRRVDGLIACFSSDAQSARQAAVFTQKGIPVILIDNLAPKTGATSVIIDNRLSGYTATRHLIEQGCKRIAHITAGPKKSRHLLRFKGYKEALLESKLPFKDHLLIVAERDEESCIAAAEKVMQMKPMPDGLFINDDFMAAVCMRTFIENKIKVPNTIAIVGFNNEIIGTLVKPSITSINYPGKEMGEVAARTLLNHFNGVAPIGSTSAVTIRAELIVRQSSLKKN